MNYKIIKEKMPNLYLYYLKWKFWRQKILVKKLKKYNLQQRKGYIAKMYRKRTGMTLNWNDLTLYTEKMQWAKLFESTEEKTLCADKYAVREWVKEKIGEQYLIPLLGVWNSYEEIPFEKLPKSFVLKTTNGSSTNIIVKNKDKLNYKEVKTKLKGWLEVDTSYLKGFEMHYSKIKPRIIAEKYIESGTEDLPDYKFLCFNGKVYYCWVDVGRYHDHKRNVYDLNWKLQPWNQYTYGNTKKHISKPDNFELMIELATQLCQGFSHVRVDLYNVKGKIYFGEMTFTNGSGFEAILPEKYNLMLGNLWKIPGLKEGMTNE